MVTRLRAVPPSDLPAAVIRREFQTLLRGLLTQLGTPAAGTDSLRLLADYLPVVRLAVEDAIVAVGDRDEFPRLEVIPGIDDASLAIRESVIACRSLAALAGTSVDLEVRTLTSTSAVDRRALRCFVSLALLRLLQAGVRQVRVSAYDAANGILVAFSSHDTALMEAAADDLGGVARALGALPFEQAITDRTRLGAVFPAP
jgi:hypothetical protein